MAYQMLDPFNYIQPGPFISKHQEWITFTLLLAFFVSVVGLALHKRFAGNRYLKPLIITTGITFAVGTYFGIYRGWLHLSFEGLGLFGAALVFIVIFFVLFGLIKGFGMHAWTALPLSYCLFYVSLWAVSPNIFDTIHRRIPILNGILLVLFIISLVKTVTGFMHKSRSPEPWALDLKRNDVIPKDAPKIEDEIRTEKQERKSIRKTTIKLNKTELKSADHIDQYLKRIEQILEKGQDLSLEEKQNIIKALKDIRNTRIQFEKMLKVLKQYVERYKSADNRKMMELRQRYHKTKDDKKKSVIKKEWILEKKKIDILNFMNANSDRITSFLQQFDSNLDLTVNYMKAGDQRNALIQIKRARSLVSSMREVLSHLKQYETYLLKLSKKEEGLLRNEKKGK